jgi:hypothetical protein
MLKLSGRLALEELAASGKYVFHGSQNGTLKKLMPIAGGSKRYNQQTGKVSEAKKYVYATKHLDLSIFIATIWRRIGASGWTTNGLNTSGAGFIFHASPEAIEEAARSDNKGYVYVLDAKQFKPDNENPDEMVCSTSIEPCSVVEVNANDLKPDFRKLASPPQV